MVTHRVRLEGVKDVDKELVGWLKQAYNQPEPRSLRPGA
jgi:hypothetical protein